MIRSVLSLLIAFLSVLPGLTQAQSAPLTDEARLAVVQRMNVLIEERYVFPEMAAKCTAQLEKLAANGSFKGAGEAEAFARALTEALMEVSQDKHLSVRVKPAEQQAAPGEEKSSFVQRARSLGRNQEKNFGFEKVERLEGNVGYLDLRYFARPSDALDTATAAMRFLENTDALIFDMRQNGGGSPGMVHFLCSYLFEERTHLNSFYYREGDRIEDYWTLPGVPGTKMPDVPVYVLTSSKTFSGAEEFSYNLRTRKRATLVGETTRGGANPGNSFSIDGQFEIFIPVGRAINPVTGTNWEGIGVQPHVSVAAEGALRLALDLARPAAEIYRAAKLAPWDALDAAYAGAIRLHDLKQPVDAARVLTAGLRAAIEAGVLDEDGVEALGQDLVRASHEALAAHAFKVKAEAFG
jgi:hypothetical protein